MILLILFGITVPAGAQACDCISFRDAQDHIDRVDVIFEGIAIGTQGSSEITSRLSEDGKTEIFDPGSLKTQFRVRRLWKGEVPDVVSIGHAPDICCICGVAFTPDTAYAVFAKRGANGSLTTSSCIQPQFEWPDYRAALSRQGALE